MKLTEIVQQGKQEITILDIPELNKKYGKYAGKHYPGSFDCSGLNVTSLKGSPASVGHSFYCYSTDLISLEGAPKSVDRIFDCNSTRITSLKGAPSFIGDHFYCYNTEVISLHNIHKQIKHIGDIFYITNCPIKSSILGLLLIDGLQEVRLDNKTAESIINKYLKTDRDVIMCQDELIEAGFPELAKL